MKPPINPPVMDSKEGPGIMLSIVVPVYNEVDSIVPLLERIQAVLKTEGLPFELIFVDDGSNDGSTECMIALANADSRVTVLRFHHNAGKSSALAAGFKEATGDYVITMDGDLQDDPSEIPHFIRELEMGFDLVSGWKFPRKDPLSKRIQSLVMNRLISALTGLKIHDINCGFKAYRKEVIKNIFLYGQLHRYIPLLAIELGYRVGEIKIKHHPRLSGKSKYHIFNRWSALLDLITVLFITRFSRSPLHFIGLLGGSFFSIGMATCSYLTWVRLVHGQPIGNRPLLTLGLLLVLAGIGIVLFGLLADMMLFLFRSHGGAQEARRAKKRYHRLDSGQD